MNKNKLLLNTLFFLVFVALRSIPAMNPNTQSKSPDSLEVIIKIHEAVNRQRVTALLERAGLK